MNVLGIRHGHDAAAAIVVNGELVASIAEERLSRTKGDSSFPRLAIAECLEISSLTSEMLDCVAFPSADVSREAAFFFEAPAEVWENSSPQQVAPKEIVPRPLSIKPFQLKSDCRFACVGHHRAHAASAFFTRPHQERDALVIIMDGIGEGVSISVWKGGGRSLSLLKELDGNSSLGWFYANATEALGWRHGRDEWKLMGLAPYGTPDEGRLVEYCPHFRDGELIESHSYGEFARFKERGVTYYHGRDALPLSEIVQNMGRENFAAEVQRMIEYEGLQFVLPWVEKVGCRDLCCAGGFFLNVKFNQRLWESGQLESQWIYPNPGDAGLAAGAALYASVTSKEQVASSSFSSAYLGPQYDSDVIRDLLRERGISFQEPQDILLEVAQALAKNFVVGFFQGRMEDGPRALGNRSILMSPLKASNKDLINKKVKFREEFRPFCPAVLAERRDDYFVGARDEFYMTTSFRVRDDMQSRIPAVVHVDQTARPQMVSSRTNPRFYELLKNFESLTGEGVLLNTSFNIRGEPIVCTPRDAIRCFFDSGIDVLAIDNFLVRKDS